MKTIRSTITQRLIDAGHESVTEFADTYPGKPLHELAAMLGGVSAIQLEMCLREEARERGTVRQFAQSYLVRCLRTFLEEGWANGPRAEFHAASAYSHWKNGLGPEVAADAKEAYDRLVASRPPVGWLPLSERDGLIEAAFEGLSFDARSR